MQFPYRQNDLEVFCSGVGGSNRHRFPAHRQRNPNRLFTAAMVRAHEMGASPEQTKDSEKLCKSAKLMRFSGFFALGSRWRWGDCSGLDLG